jgi:hypothetical protein
MQTRFRAHSQNERETIIAQRATAKDDVKRTMTKEELPNALEYSKYPHQQPKVLQLGSMQSQEEYHISDSSTIPTKRNSRQIQSRLSLKDDRLGDCGGRATEPSQPMY